MSSKKTAIVSLSFLVVLLQLAGSLLLAAGTAFAADTIIPGRITTLTAVSPVSGSVTLTWTAEGDDNHTGTATSYDIRSNTSYITSAYWATSTQVSGEPAPQVSGTVQSMTLTGLTPGLKLYYAIKAVDEEGNVSSLSVIASSTAMGDADTTAPAQVTNLAAGSATSSTITLTWTAPGDDGATGTASSYDIRYSTSTITAASWSSATEITNAPAPDTAGASESVTVADLTPSTTYYFAIKTIDEASNTSALSNIANAATTAVSTDTVAPGRINTLAASSSASGSVTLTWTAVGDDNNGGGPAASYDVRYHTMYLTSTSWPSGTLVTGEPAPANPGTVQSMTITGLTPGTVYYFAIKAIDEAGNISSLSTIASSTASGVTTDTTPPANVTNLAVSAPTGSSLTLTWTAPGDDGVSGGAAASYEIRYSTAAITAANWASATAVTAGVPAPAAPGTSQSVTVTGLTAGTAYYFALVTTDEASNASGLSNVPNGTTTSTPSDTTPPAKITKLEAGPLSSTSMSIDWYAPGDDSNEGTAASYDVRMSTAPITTANWASATQLSGEPVPLEGSVNANNNKKNYQWMTIPGLTPNTTYYFAMKATDDAGNVSSMSNVAFGTTLSTGEQRIVLTPSMILDENSMRMYGQVGATGLLDEQDRYFTQAPESNWYLYNNRIYTLPASAYIDLGANYHITKVAFYDGSGSKTDGMTVSYGTPFHWVESFRDSLGAYLNWKIRSVDFDTRYLQLYFTSGAEVEEIVLFGTKIGPDINPPSPTAHTKPLIEDFMGVNMVHDDDDPDADGAIDVVKSLREYHNWSWDSGNSPLPPNEQNAWDPSYGAGGAWHFDTFYGNNTDKNLSPVFTKAPAWLNDTNFKRAATAGNATRPLSYSGDVDTKDPASYYVFSDYLYQYAARYGSTAVPTANIKVAASNQKKTGLNLVKQMETWNEPNNDWSDNRNHYSPYEFAAMTSANIDGHEGTMGTTVGIKNADPNMFVAMGGLADFDLSYIKNMKAWFENFRTDQEFPVDALNFHAYCTDGTKGLSPESCSFKEKAAELVDYRDRYFPDKEVWISEFGYDSSQDSTVSPRPIGSTPVEEVRGQWLLRTYLAFAAAGVDRVHQFMLRNDDPSGLNGSKFATSGLTTSKDYWTRKPAWYYVYTMKNMLTGTRFLSEQSSGNANVKIYKFKSATDNSGVYVLWAPTSNNTTVSNYQLTLSGSPTTASQISVQDGSTTGAAPVAKTISSGKITVNVGEMPIFIKVNQM